MSHPFPAPSEPLRRRAPIVLTRHEIQAAARYLQQDLPELAHVPVTSLYGKLDNALRLSLLEQPK